MDDPATDVATLIAGLVILASLPASSISTAMISSSVMAGHCEARNQFATLASGREPPVASRRELAVRESAVPNNCRSEWELGVGSGSWRSNENAADRAALVVVSI
jgi:hypothetical protein